MVRVRGLGMGLGDRVVCFMTKLLLLLEASFCHF